jgi:hypothetical protein
MMLGSTNADKEAFIQRSHQDTHDQFKFNGEKNLKTLVRAENLSMDLSSSNGLERPALGAHAGDSAVLGMCTDH